MSQSECRIAVVIASKGRPVELGEWLDHIGSQTLRPVVMIWSVTGTADLPSEIVAAGSAVPLIQQIGLPGSSIQRNAGLDALPQNVDVVAFFDDDYVPSPHCLEGIADVFNAFPDVVGATGKLLADGIHDAGVDRESARSLIDSYERTRSRFAKPQFLSRYGLYGCNMAFRRVALEGVRFDENLPLYGWQEDVDFSRQVMSRGKIGWTDAFAGVHRGVKSGRTSGTRFGYSQIANPIYLYRKRTMPFKVMVNLMVRNFLANHLKSLRPESWIDRRGRMRGNWIAIRDGISGRLHPLRAIEIRG